MTAIGLLLFVFAVIAIQLFDDDFIETLLGGIAVFGFVMFIVGVSIKLWEVMP